MSIVQFWLVQWNWHPTTYYKYNSCGFLWRQSTKPSSFILGFFTRTKRKIPVMLLQREYIKYKRICICIQYNYCSGKQLSFVWNSQVFFFFRGFWSINWGTLRRFLYNEQNDLTWIYTMKLMLFITWSALPRI